MQQVQLDNLEKWFDSYVKGFYGEEEFVNTNIELKEKHSKSVCDEMNWLTGRQGLNDEQRRIALAIALLHDIGRFRQFKEYRTYRDSSSVNHSQLGVEVIRQEKVLEGFDEKERRIIETAIRYHGEMELPGGLDDETLLYCKLIRDADKIDIYRVVIEYYEQYLVNPGHFKLELEVPDVPWYTKEILEKLLAQERIDYKILNTFNDVKLLMLSWVYDVNFAATLERIKGKGFLEKVIDFLPADDDIERVRKMLFEYVDSRIKNAS